MNGKPATHGETLVHCFKAWAETLPDQVYLTQPLEDGAVQKITWREAWRQSCAFAAWLRAQNLPAGSSIGLLGRNSAQWILADAGIWLAGHVTVPLYPTLNSETAKYIIDHADIRIMVLGKLDGFSDSWDQIKNALPTTLPLFGLPMSPALDIPQWDDVVAEPLPQQDFPLPVRGALATIVYTSGSTGRPKGVMHSFASMIATAECYVALYDLGPNDRFLSHLPLAHVAERAAVEAMSLYAGCQVFFAQGLETFQADLKRARPTFFLTVPRLWTKFYLAIQNKLSLRSQKLIMATPILGGLFRRRILKQLGMDSVRYAATGSAPLPVDIINWYRNLGLTLLDCYGMSENFGASHASRPDAMRVGYVGSPVPGVSCRISAQGEVLVRSPGQMVGYYKDPERTAEEMTDDGYFHTGDRGEIDEHGRLRITGRVKELFKTTKGKYIAPAPIEQLLGNHPLIETVCVTGPGSPQPFALAVLSEQTRKGLLQSEVSREQVTAELVELLQDVNRRLEPHERLDYLVVTKDEWTTASGILTPTLKIRRAIVEERYLPGADRWQGAKQAVVWE